jgi:DNA-binding NarL/FixJ family response regulator
MLMTETQAEQRAAYARQSERYYADMLAKDNQAAAQRSRKPAPSGYKRLTPAQRAEIRRLRASGHRVVDLAERFGVNPSTITTTTRKV